MNFYGEVFGWDARVVSDTPEFRLSTICDGADQLAGIMDASDYLPEGEPDHWEVYFGVEDTDGVLAMTAELGGKVLQPGVDTPFGHLAAAADPTGASFKLIGS
ncbi:MAG: VOC family protein [Micromonosporaceae bacterium]